MFTTTIITRDFTDTYTLAHSYVKSKPYANTTSNSTVPTLLSPSITITVDPTPPRAEYNLLDTYPTPSQ